MQNLEQIIFSLPRYGTPFFPLARMLDYCGGLFESEWAKSIDPIHVVGSNGKGSVAAMTSAILSELGFFTGKYISPHIHRIEERIQAGGQNIPAEVFLRYLEGFEILRKGYEQNHPEEKSGFFEALTYSAFRYFAEIKCKALVLEAGIGGRFAETGLLPGSINLLTSIDLEHRDVLGPEAIDIACHKIDIAREGALVLACIPDKSLFDMMKTYTGIRKIDLINVLSISNTEGLRYENGKMFFDFYSEKTVLKNLECSLPGPHQAQNASLAILGIENWLQKNAHHISKETFGEAVRRALRGKLIPCRLEKISDSPEVYIDAAHTPAAMRALQSFVSQAIGKPLLLLLGISESRDPYDMCSGLIGEAAFCVFSQSRHKGMPAGELKNSLLRAGVPVEDAPCFADSQEAFAFATNKASKEGMAVLVCGSLFMAREIVVSV